MARPVLRPGTPISHNIDIYKAGVVPDEFHGKMAIELTEKYGIPRKFWKCIADLWYTGGYKHDVHWTYGGHVLFQWIQKVPEGLC
jgi:hypothetical protein